MCSSDLNQPHAIAVDATGNIYVAGMTSSDDFPLVHALQRANLGYLWEYRSYAEAHKLPQPETGFYSDGGGPSDSGENAFVTRISMQPASEVQDAVPVEKK